MDGPLAGRPMSVCSTFFRLFSTWLPWAKLMAISEFRAGQHLEQTSLESTAQVLGRLTYSFLSLVYGTPGLCRSLCLLCELPRFQQAFTSQRLTELFQIWTLPPAHKMFYWWQSFLSRAVLMADFNKGYVSVSSGFWNWGCHCAGSQGRQGTLHNARNYHKVNTFGVISKREERPDTCGLGRALKTEFWHYFKWGSQWTHLSIWGRGIGCGPVGLWDHESGV